MRKLLDIAGITGAVLALAGLAAARLGGPRVTASVLTPADGPPIHVGAPPVRASGGEKARPSRIRLGRRRWWNPPGRRTLGRPWSGPV